MEMTAEEYKNLRRQAEIRQANQRDEDRRNDQVIREMKKDRIIQNRIFWVAIVAASASIVGTLLILFR